MTKEEAKEYWTVRYEAARNWDDPHWEASERKDHRRYVDALKAAIEALSERTGEWIFNPKDAIELMFTKPKCSECGFESSDGGNYCHNCGAKMCKGGDEE